MQRVPNIALEVVEFKERNQLYQLVKKELNVISNEDKENTESASTSLRGELVKLIKMAENRNTAKRGIFEIFKFKKRNSGFNVDAVLQAHTNEFFHKFIVKHVEILTKQESGTFSYGGS